MSFIYCTPGRRLDACKSLFKSLSLFHSHYSDNRKSVLGGLACFLAFYIITYPWDAFTESLPIMQYSKFELLSCSNACCQCCRREWHNDSGNDTRMSRNRRTAARWMRSAKLYLVLQVSAKPSQQRQLTTFSSKVVPVWLFFVSYDVFISIGFAPTSSPLAVLYSRVLGPRRQVKECSMHNDSQNVVCRASCKALSYKSAPLHVPLRRLSLQS